MKGEKYCEICDKKISVGFKCRLCGRTVCAEDFEPRNGICVACKESLCEVCNEKLAIGYCKICGRLVCEACSLKDGVALVCKDCVSDT